MSAFDVNAHTDVDLKNKENHDFIEMHKFNCHDTIKRRIVIL